MVGPGLMKYTGTPSLAIVRYLAGKRKKFSLDPAGYSNHVFSVARVTSSRTAAKSVSHRLLVLSLCILLYHSAPCSVRRYCVQSRVSFRQNHLNAKHRRVSNLFASSCRPSPRMKAFHRCTGTSASSDFTAFASWW